MQPDPGTPRPQSLLTLNMNEDQLGPSLKGEEAAETASVSQMRQGTSRPPGDPHRPTYFSPRITPHHSSFSPRLRLLLSQPCSLPELSEGSGPHRRPKPPQLAVVRWAGRGWWAQGFSCYCSWAGLTSAPPHRLKAGGTPRSLSAVLHGPWARLPHRASFQELQCSVEFHLLHDVACIFRERVTQFSGLKKQ